MDSLKLTNPTFTLTIGDKDFSVRKANLEKAILYQNKIKEVLKEGQGMNDLEIVAYCTWLVVSAADETVTEDWIRKNLPADINVLEMLQTLGFMSQQKADQATRIGNALAQGKVGTSETTKA